MIKFSEPLKFFGNKRLLNDETTRSKDRILSLRYSSTDDEDTDTNLKSWEVIDMTATEIKIKLNFKESRPVSSGWERDKLTIEVNFA